MSLSSTQAPNSRLKVAVVGGGWAGLAAAVTAQTHGAQVTVFEASRHWGGRARSFPWPSKDEGCSVQFLDNGQHILIGAYSRTLALMRQVGVDPDDVLLRTGLDLRYPDGQGLCLNAQSSPLQLAWAICRASGWRWADKKSLLWTSMQWQWRSFKPPKGCDTVEALCKDLTPTVMNDLIRPLCISALNTPAHEACATVFLRVLQDALFGPIGCGDALIPKVPLAQIWSDPAVEWLKRQAQPADMRLGVRVHQLTQLSKPECHAHSMGWQIGDESFDRIIWANATPPTIPECADWEPMPTKAIATVYALKIDSARQSSTDAPTKVPNPVMRSLRDSAQHPAQFVFERQALGGQAREVAFVISDAQGTVEELTNATLHQAKTQLGWQLQVLKTVMEKKATFACWPAVKRHPFQASVHFWCAGDHVEGPYPSTLEGAIRSGENAALAALVR